MLSRGTCTRCGSDTRIDYGKKYAAKNVKYNKCDLLGHYARLYKQVASGKASSHSSKLLIEVKGFNCECVHGSTADSRTIFSIKTLIM